MSVNLQELISRGRFLFAGAPKRFEVFKLINGRMTAKDIAKQVGISQSAAHNDILRLRDFGLISEKTDNDGNPVKKEGASVYEKAPLARHISESYFQSVADTRSLTKKREATPKKGAHSATGIHVPNEQEILDICRDGETQLYEFKGPGADVGKITKEVAAFLHTRRGGIIFYGVEDDGSIIGSDQSSQRFDQRIQNSVRNSINPAPTIGVKKKTVMGSDIILVTVLPWDRKTLYQFRDGRFYIRKGTNVFAIKPEEMRKLNQGKYIV
ncbi:MAG: RNA-binding domain-containing protein [bacterium]